MRSLVLLTLLALFTGGVNGHGAMLNPPPRNAIDSTIPGDDWGDGQNRTGTQEALGVSCTNGTDRGLPPGAERVLVQSRMYPRMRDL